MNIAAIRRKRKARRRKLERYNSTRFSSFFVETLKGYSKAIHDNFFSYRPVVQILMMGKP